jgi:hypothetical protein
MRSRTARGSADPSSLLLNRVRNPLDPHSPSVCVC